MIIDFYKSKLSEALVGEFPEKTVSIDRWHEIIIISYKSLSVDSVPFLICNALYFTIHNYYIQYLPIKSLQKTNLELITVETDMDINT